MPHKGNWRPRVAVGAAVALTAVGMAGTAEASAPTGSEWSTQQVAPGVEVRTGVLGDPTAAPSWTVTVQAPATGRLSGKATWAQLGTRSWAQNTAEQLTAHGFQPRTEAVQWPDYADTPQGEMGVRVRVGSFATQAAAQSTAKSISDAGFHAVTSWTGYDAERPADHEVVHVAVIDPHTFEGTVEGTHDGNVAQRETTSSVAAKLGSLVGINGGFFVTSNADGVQGTQSGLGAYDGQLESLSAGNRAALVLGEGGRHDRIANVSSTLTAHAGAGDYEVQGVNRVPGTVRDCGRPGATPSDHAWQDVTCQESNDLVQFTPEFGAALPSGVGTQVVLDQSGHVVTVGARGGTVPERGSVLQGVGSAADWLAANATPGDRITVSPDLTDAGNERIALHPHDSIVSAAPMLVRDGRISIDAATEGVVDPADLSFGYDWANVRQPRTMAGVDAQGQLLLVTVDGRLKDGSEGFTIAEAAAFMRSLGAVQALNLDGGGSTAMAVNGHLVNNPSDATGERPVGDTIQVLPEG